eukprot:3100831-Ditylum_brightwellii.AAC.1
MPSQRSLRNPGPGATPQKINTQQAACAHLSSTPQDSIEDLISKIIAFINDAIAVTTHLDAAWLLDQIKQIVVIYGCESNKKKTKILTTIIGKSILSHLPAHTQNELDRAMKTYTDGEVTDWVTILGLPIGSDKYCQSALNDFVTKFEDDTTTLLETMSDPQTTLQ